jgi:YD repeat-containing protein
VDCITTPSSGQQTRQFAYDQLGRMTSETNAENGTTTYVYDTDATCGTYAGNLVKRTDAAGNVTCYQYDSLHRVTLILYPSGPNAPATPAKFFYYDTNHGYASGGNLMGRLTVAGTCQSNSSCAGNAVVYESFGYSARGEVTDVWETTPHSGGTYHLTQSYWEHGGLKALSGLPGLPTITYGAADGSGLDGEGRVTKINASSGTNPLTGATYTLSGNTQPIGSLTQLTLGSSDTDDYSYDFNTGRMKQYQFNVGANGNGTPAFVQSAYAAQNANATSFSTAFTSSVKAGDLLFVTFANSTTNSISAVSDTSVKPSGARERSGWYWQTVKVFRWEFGWKVPLWEKLRLRKPRLPKSVSRVAKAPRGKSPSA